MTLLYSKGDAQLQLPDNLAYDPDEEKCYSVRYRPGVWLADTVYRKGIDLVIPPVYNGFMYECVSTGKGGAAAPAFATVEKALTVDGQVSWKAKVYDLMLLDGDTITLSAWAGTTTETLDQDTLTDGELTSFRLLTVPNGANEAIITNSITVFRATGKTEKFNRSLIIPVKEL